MKHSLSFMTLFITLQSMFSQLVDWNSTFTKSQSDPLYQDSCSSGFLQSPIDFTSSNSFYTNSITIVFENYSTVPSMRMSDKYINVTATQNINMGNIIFERNGYLSQYTLADIRIKSPSEHSFNGVRYSMEIQLVHRKILGQYFSQNQNLGLPDANSNLVVSILYSESTAAFTDNGFAKDLISAYSAGTQNLQLSKYRITIAKKFYLYEGAETNYPCDENFNWIVFSDVYNIDGTSLNTVKNLYSSKFTGGSNVKTIAPLAGRPIYRNFKLGSDDNKVYVYPINSSSVVTLGFAMMVLFCLLLI